MNKLQILHLEDDAFDADLVRREVSRLGLDPTWIGATSADEFHEAMTRGGFHAIVSDNRVEGIDGLQAMQVARAQRPDLPFIFVSGNTDPHWAEHCISEGATDYVPKNQLWRLPSALRRLNEARESQRLMTLTEARAVLVDAVRDLSLARTVDDIMRIVRRASRRMMRSDGATFVLRDGEMCHYADEDAIAPMWKGLRFPMSACISGWAMLHGQPAVIPDIYEDPRIPHDAYRPTFVKSLVMVPIRAEAPIGAIGNYWATEHEASPDEIELIRALADSTSLAFENVALITGLEARVRERTAELEAVNKELEAFSYSVSHDLRAPLRAVTGYSDLLLGETSPPLADAARTFAENIQRSARRMDTLIEDMLSLSKVSRADLQPRPVQIGKMARDIVNTLQAAHPDRRVDIDIDATLTAVGDAGLLRIALENLLSNAWKFTGRSEHARVRFHAERDDAGHQVFAVTDNGAGFDMKYANQLFEPFRRLHRESEFPGTGVGLAIVKRVIEKHGGAIRVDAGKGTGACFRFTLGQTGQPGSTALQ